MYIVAPYASAADCLVADTPPSLLPFALALLGNEQHYSCIFVSERDGDRIHLTVFDTRLQDAFANYGLPDRASLAKCKVTDTWGNLFHECTCLSLYGNEPFQRKD